MLNNFKVSARLVVLVVAMVLALTVAALAGVKALADSNLSVRSQYDERLIPIARIGEMEMAIADARMHILLAFQHDPTSSFATLHNHPTTLHTDVITASRDRVEQGWNEVERHLKTADEKRQGQQLRVLR